MIRIFLPDPDRFQIEQPGAETSQHEIPICRLLRRQLCRGKLAHFVLKLVQRGDGLLNRRCRKILQLRVVLVKPGRRPPAAQLSMYGTLLEVAAHTASVDGDRRAAADYLGEATCLLYSGIVIDDPL